MSLSSTHTENLRTPLYDRHLEHEALITPFGGWDMPIQYAGIIQEHHHTRQKVSIFDTCHMGEFFIDGPNAASDLDHIVTSDINGLEPGQCRYGLILDDQAKILDDTIVYRLDPTSFMVVVNAATCANDAQWIQNHLSKDTHFHDVSHETAKIDIQGPLSKEVMETLTQTSLGHLKYFRFLKMQWEDENIFLSRTGYTGEYGYELYFSSNAAIKIWNRLLSYPDVKPAGLGARDTLRLEVGYPLYGSDMDNTKTPQDAQAMKFVNQNKDFIGKQSLATTTPKQLLVAIKTKGRRSPRHNDTILKDNQPIGTVTSGSFSPSLKCGIALGYIAKDHSSVGNDISIQGEKASLEATITTLPFYTHGSARGH